MKIKSGVQAYPVHPKVWFMRGIMEVLFLEEAGREAMITSSIRKPAQKRSLHAYGLADDFRTHDLSKELQQRIALRAKEILGKDFDVILEGPAAFDPRYLQVTPHLHIEFDPKES